MRLKEQFLDVWHKPAGKIFFLIGALWILMFVMSIISILMFDTHWKFGKSLFSAFQSIIMLVVGIGFLVMFNVMRRRSLGDKVDGGDVVTEAVSTARHVVKWQVIGFSLFIVAVLFSIIVWNILH